MALQFSKAGLEAPLSDQRFKRSGGSASFETEAESEKIQSRLDIDENDHLQPMVVEIPSYASISLAAYQEPVSGNELGFNGVSVSAFSAEEVSAKDNCIPMQEDIRNSSLTLGDHDTRKSSKLMVCYILRL